MTPQTGSTEGDGLMAEAADKRAPGEMVERLILAFFRECWDHAGRPAGWENAIPREIAEKLARAAIRAMRAPTPAMMAAMIQHRDQTRVWQAGIDAALGEGKR